MRTTLNIDDDLLERAQREVKAKTKTELIELGLKALIAEGARKRLAALHGTMPDAKAPPRRRPPKFLNP